MMDIKRLFKQEGDTLRNFSTSGSRGPIVFGNLFLAAAGFGAAAIPLESAVMVFGLLGIAYAVLCTLERPALWVVPPVCVLLGGLVFRNLTAAVSVLLMFYAAGAFAALAVRIGWGFKRTVLVCAVWIGAVMTAGFCYNSAVLYGGLSGANLASYLDEMVEGVCGAYRDMLTASLTAAGNTETGQLAAVEEMIQSVRAQLDRSLFGMMGVIAVVQGFLFTIGARYTASFASKDRELRQMSNYKVSKIGAGLFAAAFVLRMAGGTIGIVAANLYLILLPALAVEGAGYLSWYIAKKRAGGANFGIFYIGMLGLVLLLPNVANLLVAAAAILGVVDAFTASRVTAE